MLRMIFLIVCFLIIHSAATTAMPTVLITAAERTNQPNNQRDNRDPKQNHPNSPTEHTSKLKTHNFLFYSIIQRREEPNANKRDDVPDDESGKERAKGHDVLPCINVCVQGIEHKTWSDSRE